jgi:hypothetical protein
MAASAVVVVEKAPGPPVAEPAPVVALEPGIDHASLAAVSSSTSNSIVAAIFVVKTASAMGPPAPWNSGAYWVAVAVTFGGVVVAPTSVPFTVRLAGAPKKRAVASIVVGISLFLSLFPEP